MKENFISNFADFAIPELKPKYQVQRFDNKKGDRFYYFVNDEGQIVPAIGVTTFLGKVMPESKFLTDWKLKFGKDWEIVLNLTAEYGTHLHIGVGYIMLNRTMPDDKFIEEGRSIIKALKKYDKSIPLNMIEKNLISFSKFVRDYNVEPLLIEALLPYQTEFGAFYCMTQDLLCKVTYERKEKVVVEAGVYQRGEKKGQPKYEEETRRIPVTETWCVDFKSNPFDKEDKGFYDSHKYQLIATKKAVKQNFGIVADKIVNWSPLPFRNSEKLGNYELKEWNVTEKDSEVLSLYEKLAHQLGYFVPSGYVEVFNLQAENIEDMYQRYGYLEYAALYEASKNIPDGENDN